MSAAQKKSILPERRAPTAPDKRTISDFLGRLPSKGVFAEPEWMTIFEHLQLMESDQKHATGDAAPPFPATLLFQSLDVMSQHLNLVRTYARRYEQNGHCD